MVTITASQLRPGHWISTSSSSEPRDFLERVTAVYVGGAEVEVTTHDGTYVFPSDMKLKAYDSEHYT